MFKPSRSGVSQTEAARQVGCKPQSIIYAIKKGHLDRYPDGSVDLDKIKAWWSGGGGRTGRPKKVQMDKPAPMAQKRPSDPAVDALISVRGYFPDRAAAELHRATYAALTEELEYEKLAASVVDVKEIAQAVGSEYAAVRTRMLAIPAEQAPRLFALKTVLELQDMLLALITEALRSLTKDRKPE
jgi:hypothetical protein